MASNPSSDTLRPPAARRPVRGRFRFTLFLWLVLFGAGVYTGIATTKRVVAGGPAWAQNLLGVTPAPAGAPVAAMPPTNPTAPNTTPGQSALPDAANTARTAQADTAPPQTPRLSDEEAATPRTGTNAAQSSSGANPDSVSAPSSDKELDRQVEDYNRVLRRIQQSQQNYEAAHKVTSDSSTSTSNLQTLLERQNTYIGEIVAGYQRAQAMLNALQETPRFGEFYEETQPCLSVDQVPASLLNLGVDRLKFLQRR